MTAVTQNGFWENSYLKAIGALDDYIDNADKVRRELRGNNTGRFNCTEILYQSPQNIIAFSGERGSGKTSMMLSFADALKNADKLEALKKCSGKKIDKSFIVLDPVDPTALEDSQSILSVFLSKLLFYAEEYWKRPQNFCGGFQDLEGKKNELLASARKCLSGINAVKEKKGVPQNLSELQKIGDSAILKRNLCEFVELFFDFYRGREYKAENQMLVFQIDDTDCQICRGYEVLEDIRKYLTIPNVVVLMATDTVLLRQVLIRHYLTDFSKNIERGTMEENDLRSLGEKYMVKLLPPTHVVYLPNIDEFIRDKMNRIQLYYKEGEENLLRDPREKRAYEELEFQSVVLRYIYRKTHIVFTSHDAYANNIIPTTLRGLAHFLNLLSTMEDVPEIDFEEKESGETDTAYLVKRLKLQFPILEKNLSLFEQYFLNDWVQSKLPQEMLRIIESLSNQVPDQRIPFIVKKLKEKYYSSDSEARKSDNATTAMRWMKERVPSYRDLDEALRCILGTIDGQEAEASRTETDFYFIFAIRTFLTIENNKDVLKTQKETVDDWKVGEEPIVFDYLKRKTSLPNGFYVEEVDLYGYTLVEEDVAKADESGDAPKQEEERGKDKIADAKNRASKYFWFRKEIMNFNFWGAIVEWLEPQSDTYKELGQKQIYDAQALAVLIAANCDVQEAARKKIVRESRKEKTEEKTEEKAEENVKEKTEEKKTEKEEEEKTDKKIEKSALQVAMEKGFELVQNAVAAVNQDMLKAFQKGSEDPEPFWHIGVTDAKALRQYGDAIEERKKKETQLNNEEEEKARKAFADFPELDIEWSQIPGGEALFIDRLKEYCRDIQTRLTTDEIELEGERAELWKELDDCYKKLCDNLDDDGNIKDGKLYTETQTQYKRIKEAWNARIMQDRAFAIQRLTNA